MNILVSSCLLGNPCRYDGKSKGNEDVIALSKKYKIIPVCPEVMGGLKIPRNPCERINDKIISSTGKDCTENYHSGAQKALKLAKRFNCKYAVLKEKSPSCSANGIYDGSFSKKLIDGEGVTAALLKKEGIIVLTENEIDKIKE